MGQPVQEGAIEDRESTIVLGEEMKRPGMMKVHLC
jgi:hypothetical protein